MEYVEISLDGLYHSSVTTHSQWWLVVLTLPTHSWHQRLLKVQSLALYSSCYTLTISPSTFTVNYIILFADDSLVYRFINSTADHQILQSDLDTLTTWTRWNLTFLDLSVKSFKCLLIIATKSFFSYKMCNCIPLEQHIQLLKCVSTSQLDYPGNLNKH